MKQLAAIVSAIIYLVLSTGVHVHVDTCCNTVENVLMTALAVHNCSDEALNKPADCTETGCGDHKNCPSEELDIQLEEIFLVSESTQIDYTQNELELLKTTEVIESDAHQGDGQFVESPPPLLQAIYILHSSLVFYG